MATSSPTHYPNNIRQIRMEKGLTQQDLAHIMKYSLSSLSHLETGRKCPAFKTIAKLEAALQRPFREIYSEPYDEAYDPTARRRASFFKRRADFAA